MDVGAPLAPSSAVPRVPARLATPPFVLAGIVALSSLLQTLLAWRRPTPGYFPDEYMYAELGRSLLESGSPLVRGESSHFLPLLYPLLTAPAWLWDDVEHAFRTIQARQRRDDVAGGGARFLARAHGSASATGWPGDGRCRGVAAGAPLFLLAAGRDARVPTRARGRSCSGGGARAADASTPARRAGLLRACGVGAAPAGDTAALLPRCGRRRRPARPAPARDAPRARGRSRRDLVGARRRARCGARRQRSASTAMSPRTRSSSPWPSAGSARTHSCSRTRPAG